jgi:hypothetical protein
MHSYTRREWAMEQMSAGILGRETIAAALDIPPRTISSWFRAETRRCPSLLKTPREYDRAMAILLYMKFPQCLDQIAKKHQTTPRVITEWYSQVRSTRHHSELIWATRLLMVTLNPYIPEYFTAKGNELILIQGRYPHSSRARELIFEVYDEILQEILSHASDLQLDRSMKASGPLKLESEVFYMPQFAATNPRIPELKRLNGPHRYRGSVLYSDGHVDFDSHIIYRRENLKGLMRRIGGMQRMKEIRIADGLLEDTWESPPYLYTKKKLKIKYGGRWAYWTERETLHNYRFRVHPSFKNFKYSSSDSNDIKNTDEKDNKHKGFEVSCDPCCITCQNSLLAS